MDESYKWKGLSGKFEGFGPSIAPQVLLQLPSLLLLPLSLPLLPSQGSMRMPAVLCSSCPVPGPVVPAGVHGHSCADGGPSAPLGGSLLPACKIVAVLPTNHPHACPHACPQLDTQDLPLGGAPEEMNSVLDPLADPSVPYPRS